MSNEENIVFDPTLKKIIKEFFSASINLEEDDQIIYQYTTWKGLKGIINDQELWFTDYQFLNDPTEIKYAVSYFAENIFTKEQRTGKEDFYERQTSALVSKPFYFASMCAEKDYLPAWRMYADDGAGFAIGFKRKKISDGWCQPQSNESTYESIFHDIHYKRIDNVSANDKEKFKKLSRYYEEIKHDESKIREFCLAVRTLFPLIKHDAFKQEKEVRVSISDLCYLNRNALSQNLKIYYRDNDGFPPLCNSIPYIKKPFELDWITEIWAGPRINKEHAEQEINELLKTCKHSIRLLHSELPYKNPEKWQRV